MSSSGDTTGISQVSRAARPADGSEHAVSDGPGGTGTKVDRSGHAGRTVDDSQNARGTADDSQNARGTVDALDYARGTVDALDYARGQEYALLATLLSRAPDDDLIARLAQLQGDATPLGRAHSALAEAAARVGADRAAQEYFDLFVGLGRGELLPYASYYLTGFVQGRPLARLRETLQGIGIERAEGQAEPEDHAGIVFEIMAGLAGGHIAVPVRVEHDFFRNHVEPWIGRFLADLEQARAADFYARVGALGRTFMTIESAAFAFPT
jgi:TorA maturation chaperone TorD